MTGYKSGTLQKHKGKFVSPEVTNLKVPHYTVAPGAQRCQALDSSTGPHFEDEVYVFFRKNVTKCQRQQQ